jgi:two-component system NtrC family response regulator
MSRRAGAPFVAVDCAALPASLFESQLFGSKKGAFTGATTDRIGLIRSAESGTLFLDEVGELSLEQQAKLLTFIQDRTVLPVGGNERIECDVRLVAATHRDLFAMVESGDFREDLFYRLAVIEVMVPPLRARMDELPTILDELIELKAELLSVKIRRPSDRYLECLYAYSWPGNIRELGNVIERSLVLSRGKYLEAESLPRRVRTSSKQFNADLHSAQDRVSARAVWTALDESDGNKSAAARRLGISRRHLYRVMDRISRGTQADANS